MAAWSFFHPYVLTEVPLAPTIQVNAMLRLAAIEFCDETWVWQVDTDPVDVTMGENTYLPDAASSQADVATVMKLWLNDSELKPKAADDLAALYPNWLSVTGRPQYFTQRDQNNVILVPSPDTSFPAAMRMTVALKPSLSSSGIEDWIATKWVKEISAGAKMLLMSQGNVPWANPQMAAVYADYFAQAKRVANVDVSKAFGRARRRTRMQGF